MGDSNAAGAELRELEGVLGEVFTEHRGDDHRVSGPVSLDRTLWSTLREMGVTRLTAPESEGGGGAGWVETACLLRAAGAGAAALPLAENDLLAGWLLRLSACDRHAPNDAVRTAAVLNDGGVARDIPWARDADAVVVLWCAEGRWWVADVAAADVAVTDAVNYASEPRDDIRVEHTALRGAHVPASAVDEFRLRGALAGALRITGAMERVLEVVIEHTSARVQFVRPLAKFQAVQHMVADISAEAGLTRAAGDAAVAAADAVGLLDPDAEFAVAAAMSCAGHAASSVTRNAHQCLGAIGFTMEHELHRHTNRMLAWRSEHGSVRSWDDVLTAAAIAAGPRGLWPLISDRP